jgi:hypothetical protein
VIRFLQVVTRTLKRRGKKHHWVWMAKSWKDTYDTTNKETVPTRYLLYAATTKKYPGAPYNLQPSAQHINNILRVPL